MKSSIIAVGALLLAAVAAQPHGRHGHRHAQKHAKRELVVVTEYVEVTETVLYAATVWVDGEGNTISPPVTGEAVSTAQGKPFTRSVSPGVFHEPAPTPSPTSTVIEVPTSSPEPVVVEPPTTSTRPTSTTTVQVSSVASEPVVPSPAYVAPIAPSPSPVEVITPTPTPQAPAAPAQPEVAAAPAAPAGPAIGGPCSQGSPCTGDITFYQAGLGACGETHDGLTESVVALSHGMMGTQSNGNPFCGRTVSISKNGKTVSATVVDKCMGCVDGDLDLSEKAFAALGIDQSVGRTTAEWFFTS